MVIASGVMDQRRLSPFALPSSGSSSSFFSEELRIPERQSLGFWKPDSLSDQKGSKSFFSSPLEKLCLTGGVENPGAPTFKGQKDMFTLDNNMMGQEKTSSLPSTSWGDVHTSNASELSLSINESTFVEPASVDQPVPNYEMGIFSSSFSEMFTRKLRSTSGGIIGQSVDTNNSSCEQVEPLGSMEEIEAQTIGDLLPDNDDLLSGVIDDFEYTGISTNCDGAEEDIFYTGGGMELDNGSLVESTKIPEGFLSDQLSRKHPSSDVSCQKIKLDYSHSGGTRYCLTQQCPIELKQEEHSGLLQQTNNSLPGGIGKLARKNQESSSVHGLYHPVSSVMDKSLHGVYSSVTQKLSSPIRIGSMHQQNNQGSAAELSESIGEQNLGRGMQVVPPRSEPEYQNGASNNSKSITLSGMNSSRLAGMDCSHLHKTGTSDLHGHSLDPNKACGFSGIGSCPLHGHHYLWNTSNAFPQNPSTPMLWPSLQHPVHMHGFPQVQSHMLTTGVFPIDQHHLGSASSYGGSCADIHSFHPGSLGSVSFLGSPQLYPSELTVFPHTRGNCGEPMFSPVSIGFPSAQQRCHVFNGRNPMINFSTSYDAPNDRIRSRRHDGNGNQSDNKKQFELDIDHIINGEDSRTTLMIKNIPNKYTCKMLLAVIDEDHQGAYDFIYLPIDFKNKCNVGYAFINMTDPKHIVPFFKTFSGKRWEKFNSEKVASLAYARIQGRCALIAHFQNSSLMNEDKRCRPMLFHKDGPNAGDQEPFPVGNNVRSRSGRNRTFNNPDLQQQSPSTLPNQATSGGGNSPSGSTEDPLE